MARNIIKYITYAPKTETTWDTPEEKQQKKLEVIEQASQAMVKSLIKRNTKNLKVDYRGIYYNGKLGLIMIARLPSNPQEDKYKEYVVLFDIDAASDPEKIKELIKNYFKTNNLGGYMFKLTEAGTKPKGLYDQLHSQLKEGESELFFSGAIDKITEKYDWIKTALEIELEPSDELLNGTYMIEYREVGDQVTGWLHVTALSKQGILYTAQGKTIGNKDSEAESFTEKTSDKIKLVSEGKSLKPFQWDWETRSPKSIVEKIKDFVDDNKKFVSSGNLIGDELDKAKAFLQLGAEEFINGSYVVSFDLSEDGKLSYKGTIVLEHKDGYKKVYKETLTSADVTSEETTLFSNTLTTIPAPAPKIFDPKTLKTPKNIFDTLDALRNEDKFFSSGVLDTHNDVERLILELELSNEAEGLTSKSEQYTRATWDLVYTRENASDTLSYEMNIHLETTLGQRRLITIKYTDESKEKDDTTSRVLKKDLYPRLLRATIDPMIDAFSPSDLTRALKEHYPMASEYPVKFSGVILDTDRMTDLAQYYPDTQTNVVNPLALVYDIEYNETGSEQMSGKVRLTWFLESGKRVKLTGEYENAATSLANPGDELKNRVIKVLDVSSSGDGKQIMDYRYTVEVNTSPEALKARYTPYLKTGENRAYLEGVVTDPSVLSGLSRVFSQYVTTGSFDPIALFYEITYSPNGETMISWREATHILLKDGRQLRVQRQYQNEEVTSHNAPSEQFEIITSPSGGLTQEQIEKLEKLEQIIEKMKILEKRSEIIHDKRILEGIEVGEEITIEKYKGELTEGPKIYYGLNVGYNLGHKVIAGVNSNIDTSKHNILRYNGKLYLDKNTHDKTRIGDPLFIERIYQRFIKDIRGINNVYAYNAFQRDEKLVFPTVKGLFTEKNVGGSKITPYTWLFVGRGVGEYPADKEAEFSLGILGKEFSQSEYGFTVTRRMLNGQFSAVSVSFANPDKFKEIVDYYYKRASEFMLGSTEVEYPKTYPSSYLEGDKGLLEPLSLDQYAIHRTNLGTIVGSSGIVEKYLASMSDARGYNKNEEGYMPYDLIRTYESTVATAEILKATGFAMRSKPIIGPTPYLCHSSKKNTNNEYGAIALMFGQAHFCNILGGLKDWEVPNPVVRTALGITESTLSAEIVDVIQLDPNGDTAQSDRDKDYTPYIKVVFDISENGKKIARVSSIYTLDIIKHQAVEIASKPVEINS